MFEQLMTLNSANANISAQAAANQPESEVVSGFGSTVDASNLSRPTNSSTSGPGTSVTADRVTDREAQTQSEAEAEANFSPFRRPRPSDNIVLNLDRGTSQTSPSSSCAPTRSLRLRPLRMTGVGTAETEAGIATIVAQSETRRRSRNNALLDPGAQWLLKGGSTVPSSTRRRTRSVSVAAAVSAATVNVATSGGTAADGRSENVDLNFGGNGSTRQQLAPYRTQRKTQARSTQVNNGGSRRVSESSTPGTTSLPSTTTATDATAAVTFIDGDIAQIGRASCRERVL